MFYKRKKIDLNKKKEKNENIQNKSSLEPQKNDIKKEKSKEDDKLNPKKD